MTPFGETSDALRGDFPIRARSLIRWAEVVIPVLNRLNWPDMGTVAQTGHLAASHG
jgi:hypothetical protein